MADVDRSDAAWLKSPASAPGDCVEVAFVDDMVLVRHSKRPTGPVIEFTRNEWAAFLVGARGGSFDLRS